MPAKKIAEHYQVPARICLCLENECENQNTEFGSYSSADTDSGSDMDMRTLRDLKCKLGLGNIIFPIFTICI